MGDGGLSFLLNKNDSLVSDYQSFHRPNVEMAICGVIDHWIFGTIVNQNMN